VLDWKGSYVTVGGHTFRAQYEAEGELIPDSVPVFKTQSMIQTVHDVIEKVQPQRILELGIFQGGSTALIASLAPDARVVAVDIEEHPPQTLQRFIAKTGDDGRIKAHYGVDQADRDAIRRIIATEFGDDPIDFVIDDASHELQRSRASLDVILPFVRPGGCYFLEDWAWGHLMHSPFGQTQPAGAWPNGGPLTPLVFEMVMATGSNTEVFTEVELNFTGARGWRGNADLDPETFSLHQAIYDPDRFLTM